MPGMLKALALFGGAACAGAGPVVKDGPWRFTALTDRLIRIEYDATKQFMDEPTEAFPKSPNVTAQGSWEADTPETQGELSVLRSKRVELKYNSKLGPANGTLSVSDRLTTGYAWKWGDDPADGNLLGTARTLDANQEVLDLNCNNRVSLAMPNDQEHCSFGLISRKGWAVVNETGAPVWRDDWYAPSRNTVDIYVFLHGLDFAGALKDFITFAGAPALPPRYMLGTVFTRWYNFDGDSVTNFISEYEDHAMPLDAWIFDMNWHLYGPWGSFTWNKGSYPQLQSTLDFLAEKGLPVGVNTHDASGVTKDEKTFEAFAKALGRAPSAGDIPFDLYNKSYAMAQEDIAWYALQTKNGTQGVDFAWIDYQQGEKTTFENITIPNLNPTIVLNRLRSTNAARRGENLRPLILSRWGGLGNHKYPVGFSGDQMHSWRGLAYLPYFTSTAANVVFGFWSHDTVGGDHGLGNDHELSVRWFQTSAWSPVLRMHDKGAGTGGCARDDSCAKVVPWDVPTRFYKAIKEAAWKRDQLMPYMYTAAFKATSTGLTLVRPMYYEDPSDDTLYDLGHQYLFGPDMIVSPITHPSGDKPGDGVAMGSQNWTVYAPSSDVWVDVNGDFASGIEMTSIYGIKDVPHLIRQGAVIPTRPRLRGEASMARAGKPLQALDFQIAPAKAFYTGGNLRGSGLAVDDDGLTTDYTKGLYTETNCTYFFSGRQFKFIIVQSGTFNGKPEEVTVMLSFSQMPPLKVSALTGANSSDVTYSHSILGPVVTLYGVTFKGEVSLELTIDEAYPAETLSHFVGLLGRVRRARYTKDALDEANVHYGSNRANITAVALAAAHMSPAFIAALPGYWVRSVVEATTMARTDGELKGDLRRREYVWNMMTYGEEAAKESAVATFV